MGQKPLSANKIRILDFDSSIPRQKNFLRVFNSPPYSSQIIDCKDIASASRYWASRKMLNKIKERANDTCHNAITLYGSGDFHHISLALLENFTESFSLIVFDHHPDWDGLSAFLSCGSWVSRAAKNENIKKIMLLGPSSDDLSPLGLATADFSALKRGKLEIFPYRKKPSRIFLRYLENSDCLGVKRDLLGSTLFWNNLEEKTQEFYKNLLQRLPTHDVYISIDKDCLLNDYAITNWEEGTLRLDWLLGFLSLIKKEKNIIGVDITGEYSEIILKNPLKNFLSKLDHPNNAEKLIDKEKINLINEETNIKILSCLLG